MMTAHSWSGTTISDNSQPDTGTTANRSKAVDFDQVLEMLSDEYACEILRQLDDSPKAAPELIDQCQMSRPTVYRRLEAMAEASLIDSRQSSTGDGRQRTEYYLVVDTLEFELHPDGLTGTVRSDAP